MPGTRAAREDGPLRQAGAPGFEGSDPERLQHDDDLWIDCAGDEYDDPDDDVRFSYAPVFNFAFGGVGFEVGWFDAGGDDCGSASGFLPHW